MQTKLQSFNSHLDYVKHYLDQAEQAYVKGNKDAAYTSVLLALGYTELCSIRLKTLNKRQKREASELLRRMNYTSKIDHLLNHLGFKNVVS